jgi:hypothetical protein
VIDRAPSETRYGPPDPGKRAKHRSAKGRLCQQPGCTTILSTYNAADRCSLHTEPSFRHQPYRG